MKVMAFQYENDLIDHNVGHPVLFSHWFIKCLHVLLCLWYCYCGVLIYRSVYWVGTHGAGQMACNVVLGTSKHCSKQCLEIDEPFPWLKDSLTSPLIAIFYWVCLFCFCTNVYGNFTEKVQWFKVLSQNAIYLVWFAYICLGHVFVICL